MRLTKLHTVGNSGRIVSRVKLSYELEVNYENVQTQTALSHAILEEALWDLEKIYADTEI